MGLISYRLDIIYNKILFQSVQCTKEYRSSQMRIGSKGNIVMLYYHFIVYMYMYLRYSTVFIYLCKVAITCSTIHWLYVQSNLNISNSDISNSAKLEASIKIKNTVWLFSYHNLALVTFLQVQITRSAKSPINFEPSTEIKTINQYRPSMLQLSRDIISICIKQSTLGPIDFGKLRAKSVWSSINFVLTL